MKPTPQLDLPLPDPDRQIVTCTGPELANVTKCLKEQGFCIASASVNGSTYTLTARRVSYRELQNP